jgi:hypothetical protein
MRSSNVRERGLRGEKPNPLMLIDVDVQDDLPQKKRLSCRDAPLEERGRHSEEPPVSFYG